MSRRTEQETETATEDDDAALEQLAKDAGLSDEDFERLMESIPPASPNANFLAGVQDKLFRRSGGRFYRDRYSRMPAASITLWLTVAVLVAACALWFLFR